MKVLMKSKVIFVSALGVHLLTSFWVCLWFCLSTRSCCLTLGKEKQTNNQKQPPAVVILARRFCRSFQLIREMGGFGSIFPFQWFSKEVGSVWATIITSAKFPTHALRALCSPHYTLCTIGPDWQ